MKKTILILLSLILLLLSVFNINALTSTTYKSYGDYNFYADKSNAVIVSFKDNKAIINIIGKGYVNLNCSADIKKSQYANNMVHLFYVNNNKRLSVLRYNIINDSTTDVQLDINTKLDYKTVSVSSSGYYYATDTISKTRLYQFKSSGEFSKSFDLDFTIMQSDTFSGKNVIIRTIGGLFCVNSDKVFYLSDKYFPRNIKMINDSSFICDGNIYSIDENTDIIFSCDNNNAGVISKGFVYSIGNKVYFCPGSTGDATKLCDINNKISGLYGYSDKVYAITDKNVYIIKYSDLKDIKKKNTDDTINISSASNGISSNAYVIDEKYISEVMPSTSVSRFKNNLNFGDYELNLYDGEYYVPSGNVYTGLTASFTGNGTINKTIIVKGDIDCDGKLNSNDIDLMMSCMLKTASLGKLESKAGDMNKDGKLSNKDLVAMAQLKK